MNKITKRPGKYFLLWLVSGSLLLVFILTTDPLELALPILLVPFVAFFIWIRSAVISAGMLLRPADRPGRKLRVFASAVAAIALVVVTLQSLGQLTWRDLILTTSLVLSLIFYLNKTDVI